MENGFNSYKIILASASPRRKELLSLITKNFEIIPSNAEEPLCTGYSPEQTVLYLSEIKAHTIPRPDKSLIIGADTLVYCDGERMGKPENHTEAKKMLQKLSGKAHAVYTGVTVINTATDRILQAYEKTLVYFTEMSETEIDEYINTGEPFDKAGGYGIQGEASKYITGINGCYFNVVGLPVRLTYKLLTEALKK